MKAIKATVIQGIHQFNKGEKVKILQYFAVNTDSQHGNYEDGILVVRKNGELGTLNLSDVTVNYKSI